MNWIAVAGTLAALCSTISFVPQAWRIVRTRDTKAISPLTYSLTVTGFALWTTYGLGLGEWPLIITNSICFVLSAFILIRTLLRRPKKEAVAETIDPAA
ncbi:MAG: SemiSWEET transporter [Bosea sp.]|uniref:SemiSWEET family sugar transporter n=1 Tax=Bosea sp. (in: a-proteobacteria) TaxID=1871050 RepID=UPI001AC74515|nr:SemiSWEET transporter [Bosea sp. (in: a-proteobacteria)]MBN9452238.1 SemiSWEET transporter [Bosea sp. (in: a-proteobacteria)]